jgi:hypothetical protein
VSHISYLPNPQCQSPTDATATAPAQQEQLDEAAAAAGNRARLLAILTKNANSTSESLLAVKLREALLRLAAQS